MELIQKTTIQKEEKKRRKGKVNPLVLLWTQLVKTLNQSLRLLFNSALLILQPMKLLNRVIQLIKARAFSIVLLIFTGILVYFATIDYLPIVLKTFYPLLTDQAALERSMVIAISSEFSLVYLEINRKRIASLVVMVSIVIVNILGLTVDVFKNHENLLWFQLAGQVAFGVLTTSLTMLILYYASKEASKVAKNKSLDKVFTGSVGKSKTQKLSKDARETLVNQIIEHANYHFSQPELRQNLSFNSVAMAFSDRVSGSEYVKRKLKEKRPDIFNYIMENKTRGRKPKSELVSPNQDQKPKSKVLSFFSKFTSKPENQPDKIINN